jgi:uncharacterized protein YbjT (DUF2867 family)
MNVLITGGTGTLGRHVVTLLRQSGHRARIFSRHPRGHVDAVEGDLRTGAGLDKAVAGMDAIVHAATGARESFRSRSDVQATRRLLEAARRANIKHLVYPSIVGIDASSYAYHVTKLKAEAVIRAHEIPWSILRATQFHDLIDVALRGFSRMPGLVALPYAWRFQPVDALEVAQRVVDVVLREPTNQIEDFAGPEIADLKTFAEKWLAARKEHRLLLNLPMPFRFSKQWAAGNLTAPEGKKGKVTFEEFLADRYAMS